jgi:hypothetical protein
MILHDRIKNLTSGKREFNRLYNADNLYIAWGIGPDDDNVTEFSKAIGAEYYTSCDRLVGKHRGNAQIENKKVTGPIQGYIYTVSNKQTDMFEKVALIPSMRFSRRFEHYDLNKIKQQEQQEIIEKLKEENNA